MRAFILAVLIIVASQMPAVAQNTATMPPATYPAQGVFCGFMELCAPKAAAPVPADATATGRGGVAVPAPRPVRR
ncbi:MAG: hypothetical protein AAFY39_02060 [Pseudomonadota bacterium]